MIQFLTAWKLFQNTLLNWVIALIVFALTLAVLLILRNHLFRRLVRTAGFARTRLDGLAIDLLDHTRLYLLLALAFYAATIPLEITDKANEVITPVVITLILLQAAVWGSRLITYSVTRALTAPGQTIADNAAAINLAGTFARAALWVLIILLILDNIRSFNISTLLTSLGIGGLAVAIAVQRILGDLFASLSIALDKPFTVGDFIVVGPSQGTVEAIGLKSTRVRALTGEQLIISNSDLLASRIQNFHRMQDRRVSFDLRVATQATYEQLTHIPAIVETVIEGQPMTRFERAHLSEFGTNFYCFEIVYYVLSPDYDRFKETQQAINLGILKAFDAQGIKLAFA